ncbi:hypothetical protein M422DRAFT_35070 [Sphaerobolus stellatus SS14]|uniref:dUTPase-like domain-containing protein n=1 Tax=Sphaerobolus stellatus (strain SS14) TaxID=990650 RepID=A0A0C9VB86_SPHS4|nr:hypothetical protein M422DRAFT_35070 [Sphaerobolus stellatus SS14]
MILPGYQLISRGIIRGIVSAKSQVQPCGVDLTLKHVLAFTGAGVIDADNTRRQTASTRTIEFTERHEAEGKILRSLQLKPGSYLVEFNETVDTPLDTMGQLYVRSSLFRSGAVVNAGVMDAGYTGAIGALLQVMNPHGIVLYENAKLAQFVFHQMSEEVEGYSGIYQNQTSV